MSREDRRRELGEKTQVLLQGSLKHVRAAALAAALVPLASVGVSQAVAAQCMSGGCPPPPGLNSSEQAGSVIVFPKVIRGTVRTEQGRFRLAGRSVSATAA